MNPCKDYCYLRFGKQYSADCDTSCEFAKAVKSVEKAIESMIQSKVIKFKSLSKYCNVVDVDITSDVFTDKKFISSVYEDDWNSCPDRAVASELSKLVIDGELEFAPLTQC